MNCAIEIVVVVVVAAVVVSMMRVTWLVKYVVLHQAALRCLIAYQRCRAQQLIVEVQKWEEEVVERAGSILQPVLVIVFEQELVVVLG